MDGKKKEILKAVLAEKADRLLELIALGEDIRPYCQEIGVYPAQVEKYFKVSSDYRERYREALATAAELNAEIAKASKGKGKNKGKVEVGKKFMTQVEVCALFEQEILDSLTNGALVRDIANGYQIDAATISRYFRADEARAAKYAAALEDGGHALADESVAVTRMPALDLVDTKVMELRSSRLAWLASKRNRVYDARQQLDVKGQMAHSISIDISGD